MASILYRNMHSYLLSVDTLFNNVQPIIQLKLAYNHNSRQGGLAVCTYHYHGRTPIMVPGWLIISLHYLNILP